MAQYAAGRYEDQERAAVAPSGTRIFTGTTPTPPHVVIFIPPKEITSSTYEGVKYGFLVTLFCVRLARQPVGNKLQMAIRD